MSKRRLLLLVLLAAGCWEMWLLIEKNFTWWGINPLGAILCFVLIMLFCIAMMLPHIPLTPYSPGILYWSRFAAGVMPFMIFTMLASRLCLGSNYYHYHFAYHYEFYIICLGFYVVIFFIAVMMPKSRRPVVLVIAIPVTLLLFILLAPGIMSGIALFGSDSFIQDVIDKITFFNYRGGFEGDVGSVVGLAAASFFSLCIIFLPFWGYKLWTERIVANKKYLPSLLSGVGLMIVSSITLCVITEIIGQSRLSQAKQDAKSVGLLDTEQILQLYSPTQVAAERNSANLYYEAFKILNTLRTDSSLLLYTASGNKLSSEEKNELIKLIQSPEGKHINTLLEQAVKYPECRFMPEIARRRMQMFVWEMNKLADFVQAQAYVYKQAGQVDKILPEIEKSFMLAEKISNEQISSSFNFTQYILENAITGVIKIGPENPTATISYSRMLDYLNQHPVNYLCNDLEWSYNYFPKILAFQCSFDDGECHNNFSKYVLWADLLLGYPLVLRNFTDDITDSIKVRREMLKIREMQVLPPDLSRMLDDYSLTVNHRLRMSLTPLFRARSMREMLRIGLALKIYKCKHGKFPASLQELVPPILPTIPIDPINGKSFGYKLESGNFILKDNSNTPRELSSEFKLKP